MENVPERLNQLLNQSKEPELVNVVRRFLSGISETLSSLESKGDALGEVNAGEIGNITHDIDVAVRAA